MNVHVGAAALLIPLALAACAAPAGTRDGGSPGGAATAAPTSYPPGGAPTGSATTVDDGPAGLLREIRTAPHGDHDRLVFEFHGRSAPTVKAIRYEDRITEDPSDRPVPLAGQAFVWLVFDGATLDTRSRESDPADARRYTGPERLTPRHPLLQEVAVAGDFEQVLSFGIGLARPAAIGVHALADPARVAIDFWYATPDQLLWPARTRDEARRLQDAADAGHQPWLTVPGQVVASYVDSQLGWPNAEIRQIAPTLYQAHTATSSAVISIVAPFPTSRASIWVIAEVAEA